MLPKSAEKWICMGKWAVPCGVFYFSGFRRAPIVHIFSGGLFASNAFPEKN